MIISFFGHSDFLYEEIEKESLLQFLEQLICEKKVDFYLGGYGKFDSFAREICNMFCKKHKNAKKVFVSPYLGNYLENRKEILTSLYDEILYPPLEGVPNKFAIIKRNEWMALKSDVIIVYVKRNYGGAYTVCEFAKRKEKKIINIYNTPLICKK